MKFSFSFKKREASFEAEVEKLIEKGMDQKERKLPKKTRYQIKQEEKRKNAEMKHRQEMQKILVGVGAFIVLVVFVLVVAILENTGMI